MHLGLQHWTNNSVRSLPRLWQINCLNSYMKWQSLIIRHLVIPSQSLHFTMAKTNVRRISCSGLDLCVWRWAKQCQINLAETYLWLASTLLSESLSLSGNGLLSFTINLMFLPKKGHSIPHGYRFYVTALVPHYVIMIALVNLESSLLPPYLSSPLC